jgi:Zn-dependent protease
MFGKRISLFKLFGFEVRLDASWLLIAALVTWSLAVGIFPQSEPGLSAASYWWMGLSGAVLLFGSIIVHELFHSLAARRYGLEMSGITLFVFGGIAEMKEEPPSAKAEFMMAIAGPIASVLLGAGFYFLFLAGRNTWPFQVVGVVQYLYWINWILAAFNMLPAFPLDGGRVLRSALWHSRGDLRSATRTAARIGGFFGILLVVLGIFQLFTGNFVGAVWWFLIGMFLRGASQTSYEQVVIKSALEGEPVSKFMREHPDTVTPDTSVEVLVNEHIYRHHHKMFPVVTGSDQLTGCVSVEQVKGVPREEWSRQPVSSIMAPCSPDNTISPEKDVTEALARMQQTGTRRLMVVDHGHLVAMLSLGDLLSYMSTKVQLEEESRKA